MAIQRITKRVVDAAQPGDTDLFLWDADLAGFGLKVTPSGRKTYVIQYRVPGLGRRGFAKRFTLGEHGPRTPEEARRQARRELGRVAQGSSPAAERAAKKQMIRVSELSASYLDEVDRRRKPGTAREYRRLWTKHILPALGTKQVSAVTSADICRLHRLLHKTPYVANRVVARLSTFFVDAIREGVLPSKDSPTDRGRVLPGARPRAVPDQGRVRSPRSGACPGRNRGLAGGPRDTEEAEEAREPEA